MNSWQNDWIIFLRDLSILVGYCTGRGGCAGVLPTSANHFDFGVENIMRIQQNELRSCQKNRIFTVWQVVEKLSTLPLRR
jgi:hypothetical protein